MNNNENLTQLRNKIDEIDINIKNLLLNRLKLVKEIGDYKKKAMLEIEFKDREENILNNLTKNLNNIQAQYVKEIYSGIFISSKNIQK